MYDLNKSYNKKRRRCKKKKIEIHARSHEIKGFFAGANERGNDLKKNQKSIKNRNIQVQI